MRALSSEFYPVGLSRCGRGMGRVFAGGFERNSRENYLGDPSVAADLRTGARRTSLHSDLWY